MVFDAVTRTKCTSDPLGLGFTLFLFSPYKPEGFKRFVKAGEAAVGKTAWLLQRFGNVPIQLRQAADNRLPSLRSKVLTSHSPITSPIMWRIPILRLRG